MPNIVNYDAVEKLVVINM